MSFLRALRAYIGLGPDEDIEDRYLYELNSRRRELDLDELEVDDDFVDEDDEFQLELESDDVVIVTPGSGGRAGARRANDDDGRRQRPRSISRQAAASPIGHIDLTLDEHDEVLDRDDFDFASDGQPEPALAFDVVEDPTMIETDERNIGAHDLADEEETLDFLDDDSFAEYIPRRRSTPDIESETVVAEAPTPAETPDKTEPADSGVRTKPRRMRRAAEEKPKKAEEAVVRSLDSMRAKPRTLAPESFADAKLVADEFKRDIPVLLNLQGLDRDLARRLIDFASGICYALDGSMEKIASQVFLLIPESGEVSDEDRRRIEERGYAR